MDHGQGQRGRGIVAVMIVVATTARLDGDAAHRVVLRAALVLRFAARCERIYLVLARVAGLGVNGALSGVLPQPRAQERLYTAHRRAGPRGYGFLVAAVDQLGLSQFALLGFLQAGGRGRSHYGEATGHGGRRRRFQFQWRTVHVGYLLLHLLIVAVEDGLRRGKLDRRLVELRVVGEVEMKIAPLLLHLVPLYRRGRHCIAVALLGYLRRGRRGRVRRAEVYVPGVVSVALGGVNGLAEVIAQRYVARRLWTLAKGRTVEAGSGRQASVVVIQLADGRWAAVVGVRGHGVLLVLLAAHVLVGGDAQAGNVAVEEAQVDQQDGRDGGQDADDGDDDEGAGAGERQTQRQRHVVHARVVEVPPVAPDARLQSDQRQLGNGDAQYAEGGCDSRD